MSDEKKETKKDTTSDTSSTKARGRAYTGPDYQNALVVGKGKYDPKAWDEATIEKMIKHDPALTRYFK